MDICHYTEYIGMCSHSVKKPQNICKSLHCNENGAVITVFTRAQTFNWTFIVYIISILISQNAHTLRNVHKKYSCRVHSQAIHSCYICVCLSPKLLMFPSFVRGIVNYLDSRCVNQKTGPCTFEIHYILIYSKKRKKSGFE